MKPIEIRFHPNLMPPLITLCAAGLFALYITYVVLDERLTHYFQILAGVETVDLCDYENVCGDFCSPTLEN